MRLSVIIPGAGTIKSVWIRCLRSVLAALTTSDEILCVDDGDRTGAFFLDDEVRRDIRIRVIHRRNGGPSVARNTAMTVCRGKWVTFVDSDDEVLSHIYTRTLRAMQRMHADVGLFGVRTVWVTECLFKEDIPQRCDYERLSAYDLKNLADECLLNYPCNKIYKGEFLLQHALSFAEKGMPCEDIVFNLECIISGARLCSVDSVGYIYYRTGTTLLSRYRPFNGEGLKLCTETWKRYCETSEDAMKLFRAQMEYSEGRFLWSEWDNIWRPFSPFSIMDRLRFLYGHRSLMMGVDGGVQARLLSVSPIILVLVRCLYQVFRRWFYVNPIRRWHIRRLYPYVERWSQNVN